MAERMISHYRIVETLGEGGMGVVYRAIDTRLNRPVALKVLPPDVVADPDRRRRFQQEAQAASALNHPNIITVYDIGETEGTLFIAMECVAGRTMDELIPSDGMPLPDALKYAVQIADAFSRAHAAGIVHRDLKPGNLMVTADGLVKVLDFGLAKLTETGDSRESTTVSMRPQTRSGTVLGTPAFMSPEQAAGETVDARSDIFSFGAVLYELVTGRRAFRGDSPVSTVAAVLSREPEPLPGKIPPELARVILRSLRKDRARRYQSMGDLKVELEDLRELSVSGRREGAAPVRRWAWAAAAAVLLLLGFFAWRVRRGPDRTEPQRAVPLATFHGVQRYPSFSPDGDHVAFTWSGPKQDNPDIYVQMIGSGSPLRLTTDPGNDYNPAWSPDGRSIAFLRRRSEASDESELRLVPPLGGPERKAAEIRVRGGILVTPPHLAWYPDGAHLIVTDSPGEGKSDALFAISLETGEKKQLTNPQPPVTGDTNPAVSSDGSRLVFRRMATLFSGELYEVALRKGPTAVGEPRRLTPATLDAEYPTWIPGGREILFSARGSLWRLAATGQGGTPARLPFVGEDGLMPVVSHSESGRPSRLVYVRSLQDFNIWRVETSAPGAPASSPPVLSVSSTRSDSMPQLSPDGRRVAFTSDRSGGWEIWLADPDGSNAVQLTSMGARASGYPHWSPDGDRIVFHSNLEGQWDIYSVAAAGGKPRNVTSHPATESFPSFSRDGRWIYFNSSRTGDFQRIWKIPASGGDVVPVPDAVGFAPMESPDGASLYFVQTVDAPSPLWRVPTSGGVPVKVVDGVALANFVVLERGIYYVDRLAPERGIHYVDRPSGETRLQYFDFVTRKSTMVARNLGRIDLPITASADGRTIFYSREDSWVDDLMLVENFQ